MSDPTQQRPRRGSSLLILSILGVFVLKMFPTPWQMLDVGGVWGTGAVIAVLLAFMMTALRRSQLRLGRASQLTVVTYALGALVLWPVLLFMTVFARDAINCLLDASPVSSIEAQIEQRATRSSRSSVRFVATVSRTPQSERAHEIEVDEKTFQHLQDGAVVMVQSRQGLLGREWCKAPCIVTR